MGTDQQHPRGGGRHRRPTPDPYPSPELRGEGGDGLDDPRRAPLPGRTGPDGYLPEHPDSAVHGYPADERAGSGWQEPGGQETSFWFQPRAGRTHDVDVPRADRAPEPLPDPLTGSLSDPLTDPLPGPSPDPLTDPLPGTEAAAPTAWHPAHPDPPGERYHDPLVDPLPDPGAADPLASPGPPGYVPQQEPWDDTPPEAGGAATDPILPGPVSPGPVTPGPVTPPTPTTPTGGEEPPPLEVDPRHDPLAEPGGDRPAPNAGAAPVDDPFDHTMTLRPVDRVSSGRTLSATPPGEEHTEATTPTGGRAARRRARRAGVSQPPPGAGRAARRRALRAQKPGPGVIASRVIGELFITCGVLLLLFVVYQVWWTNVLAHRHTEAATNSLREEWEKAGPGRDRASGPFAPGEEFAIMYIPKLDVTVPIAEGTDKQTVLDNGMLGHYSEGDLKTAMPWDKTGNFAVAGHRNTHGEPFRYINRLVAGDPIVVETKNAYYTYEMTSRLPSTPPSNTDVLSPVPRQSGFTKPGRYITLTTCTPEFTSKYRLIVWGKLVEERPRSKGKPDALTG